MRPDPIIPDRLDRLNAAEHTLLLILRAVVTDKAQRLGCTGVMREFCGHQAQETLDILNVLIQRIALLGRREVRMGQPGMTGMTRDEQLLLAMFASAQANDYPRLSAHLTFLLGREPDAGFIAGAACVADTFLRHGGRLRLPTVQSPHVADPIRKPPRGVWRGLAS